ncbi:hypothetical protein D3C86_1959780 [compost metagenome]
MLKHGGADNGAVAREDCIQQLNGKAGVVVLQNKLQRLRFFIAFGIDGRKPF